MRTKLYVCTALVLSLIMVGTAVAFTLSNTASCCPDGDCCPDGACCIVAVTKEAAQPSCCTAPPEKASCCPDGECCPDGACCGVTSAKTIAKASCCPDGECCPDGACCVAGTTLK